jgi:hypothetical protein
MRRDIDQAASQDQTATSKHTASDETSASQEYETGQRYTVHEAALLLGLSIDAVRKRAERGRLRREKAPDGTVYIFLDSEQAAARSETGQRATGDEAMTSQDALVNSLQDQIEYLRHELDIRNEELRRKDHLLTAALERIPELEASPGVSSENAAASEGGTEPQGSSEIPSEGTTEGIAPSEEPARRRSWLYRFFFGP